MLRIGLTGGIGSGKSTVAGLFANLGVPVIDTDVIAHDLTQPGTEGYRLVVKAVGEQFLNPNGLLDRQALRRHVFRHSADRKRLEAVLHPLIRQETLQQLARVDADYVIVVVPLLLEAGFTDLVDRILVVDADEQTQIRRVQARGALPENEIRAIMQAQLNRQARLASAHDVLNNNDSLSQLEQEVSGLHRHYLQLAQIKH